MHRSDRSRTIGNHKIVFLVWDRQSIRASGIARHIGASLHFLYTSRIKHPLLFLRTLQVLRKEKPKIIICQSPPITCPFMAMMYKLLFARKSKPKILIDAHTGAVSRPGSKSVTKLVMKKASSIIVINKEQQDYLSQYYKISAVVLEDPIPDFSNELKFDSSKREDCPMVQKSTFNIAVISSFASDEPLKEVFDVASELPDMHFYITGDGKYADKDLLDQKSDNITITGFLEYGAYVRLLRDVDVIMDLTTDNTSVVAGAFEAVALEQPLIISDWIPLRRCFNRGTIYTNNSTNDIKEAIMKSVTKKKELSKEMHDLKIEKTKEWSEKISKLSYIFQE